MIDWFHDGGYMMWPLLALALGVIGMAARAAIGLRRGAGRRHSLGTILFWGAVALLLGALGTAVGLVIMAQHIVGAGGAASPQLIWSGVSVTLVTLIFGILIFLLSGFLWLGLDAWSRRLPDSVGASDVGLPAIALLLVLGGCGDADGSRFVVTDSAGIRIAASPGPDRALPTPVRLAELQPPDSGLTAMPWGVVADPATGRVFVADGTAERVVVFEADGRFVRTIGRAGAAVGYEDVLSPVTWLAANPSGRIWVSRGSGQPVPDRVDILASDGRYLGTFDAPGLPVAFPSDSTFVALEVTDVGEPVLALYRLRPDNGATAGLDGGAANPLS